MNATALVTSDATAARRAAASILRQGRFHPPSVPRPLHGLLHAIGTGLDGLGNDISTIVDDVGRVIPGGSAVAWVLLGLIVVGAVVIVARRGRFISEPGVGSRAVLGPAERPEELEREAEAAERDGRFADAVRLRFRAGLVRLADRDARLSVRFTPNAAVGRIVNSPDFDGLTERFDEITYGAAPATEQDARDAQERWNVVLGRGLGA